MTYTRFFPSTAAALLAIAVPVIIASDDGKDDGKTKAKAAEKSSKADRESNRRSQAIKALAEREAVAHTFAKQHHPELIDLLTQLKKKNRAEYNKAVRDLFTTSERLAKIEERLPDRYEYELKLWKLDSRVRLLLARWSMSESASVEHELRDILRQRLELRVARLSSERDRLVARVEKLEKSIAGLADDPEASVEAELKGLKRRLGSASKTRRRTTKNPTTVSTPAGSKPSAKDSKPNRSQPNSRKQPSRSTDADKAGTKPVKKSDD